MFGRFHEWSLRPLVASLFLISLTSCQRPAAPSTANDDPTPREETPSKDHSIVFCESLDDALTQAAQENRRILVYFTGEHCGWCRRMEKETHTDPQVIEMASKFVCVKIDIGQQTDLVEK